MKINHLMIRNQVAYLGEDLKIPTKGRWNIQKGVYEEDWLKSERDENDTWQLKLVGKYTGESSLTHRMSNKEFYYYLKGLREGVNSNMRNKIKNSKKLLHEITKTTKRRLKKVL